LITHPLAGYKLDGQFSVPLTEQQAKALVSQAREIMATYPVSSFSSDTLAFNPDFFIQDAYDLGKEFCYLNGTLASRTQVTLEYATMAQELTLKRVALGGYRLRTAIQSTLATMAEPARAANSEWVVVVASFASIGLGMVLGALSLYLILWYRNKPRQQPGYAMPTERDPLE
jgi:hypothetical protein